MGMGRPSLLYTAWMITILFVSKPHGSDAIAPEITDVTPLTSRSLRVRWNPVPGNVSTYTVCYDTNNSDVSKCSNYSAVAGNISSTNLTGLNEATTYFIAVRADSGELGNTTSGTTREDIPGKGPNIGITVVNSTAIKVTWKMLSSDEANGRIVSYTVCYTVANSKDGICSKSEVVDGKTTVAILDKLTPFTTYNVSVKANTSVGAGPLGNVETKTTSESAPSKGPTILMISAVNSSALNVLWVKLNNSEANGIIVNYTVCYKVKDSGAANCSSPRVVKDGDASSTILSNLTAFTTYVVFISASTSAGKGPPGPSATGKTDEAAPVRGPNVITVVPYDSTKLKVTWETLSERFARGKITEYEVCYEVAVSSQSTDKICVNSRRVMRVDNTTFVLDGLNEATTYFVAVKASTSAGFGPIGNELSGTTFEDRPAKGPEITGVTGVPANSSALNVTWGKLGDDDANGKIVSYTVCYKILNSPENICSASRTVYGGETLGTILFPLVPFTTYNVSMSASTAVGSGPLGNSKLATTSEAAPSKGPNITTVFPTSSKSLNVSWKQLRDNVANGNITKYKVCYKLEESPPSVHNPCDNYNEIVFGVNNTTFELTGLNEATVYIVGVQAATTAGFGPTGNTLTSSTLEDVPSKGPNVSTILPVRPLALQVTWNELNKDDSNGKIINYTVCYKKENSPRKICDENKTVVGVENTSTTLEDLDPYTLYEVAVKAATRIGAGKIGMVLKKRTAEGPPDEPQNLRAVTSFAFINLTWAEPDMKRGEISHYRVCWNSTCRNVSDARTRRFPIADLMPGTVYYLSVSAFTGGGKGKDAVIIEQTKPSGVKEVRLNAASEEGVDETTQIAFRLPLLTDEETGQIRRYLVIVKRWTNSDDDNTFASTRTEDLKKYGNSEPGVKPYITLARRGYSSNTLIIVGNNSRSSSSARRRRDVSEYYNRPLTKNTQYGIFVRIFYTKEVFANTPVLLVTTKDTGDDGLGVALIVVIVILVLVIMVFVVLGALYYKRRKPLSRYEDMGMASLKSIVRDPIPIEEFRAHCEQLGHNSNLGYQEEYECVRAKGPVSSEIAKRSENVDKNRYNNIHAYDSSRVVLSQIDGEEGSDYINANHIDGYERKEQFIAAQGPLKSTLVDFWRMIWEQGVNSIVMLANPIEKGREKVAIYWPQDRAVKHGPFLVKLDGEVELADYVIRKMTVTKDDEKETRQLTQFHYTVWPDHGVPQYTTSLQAFLTRIRKTVRDDTNPVVVHCSAGVGRTGTFIGIFAMLDMIESTKTVDIYNFVCKMRAQRTHMVQVEAQYVFLHKAVLEAIECGDTEINAPDLRVKMNQLNRKNPDNPEETMMDKQFQVLGKYTVIKSNTDEGRKPYNVDKNRNKNLLPYEDTRVSILKSPGVDGSDYINASFIDSYQVRGMYIATQFPLEKTMNAFWRMVWEKNVNCIVMLANLEESGYQKYWTDDQNDAQLCANLLVSLDNMESFDEFVVRSFKIKKNDGGETRNIWHFSFLNWSENEVPKTTVGIRQMIGQVQDVQRKYGNNSIVVHCCDGGGRTGAFCALVTSLERVKQDQSFNLFQTIMLERIQRPKMVTSVGQYRFCFKCILDFLDSFDQYANFLDLRQ